jgi:hypothetical protein
MKEEPKLNKILHIYGDNVQVSDGYHTFDELYDHRVQLFITLCKKVANENGYGYVWRSKLHSDESSFDGWFVMGIDKDKGRQITYHLPMSKWDETSDLMIETLPVAPEFDGHSSDDVLKRLQAL